MTYEEALHSYRIMAYMLPISVSEKVVEALEKQIAKKPIGAYKTCDTGEITYWECPTCNYEHESYGGSCEYDCCPNCGQVIDWSWV